MIGRCWRLWGEAYRPCRIVAQKSAGGTSLVTTIGAAISTNPLSMTCAAIATPSRPSDLPGTTSAADLSGLTSLRLLSLGRAEFHYQFGMSVEQPQ